MIYILPLLLVFLISTVFALVIPARARRGYGPPLLGLLSAVAILAGKFLYGSSLLAYAGITGLLLAVIWHACPKHLTDVVPCAVCKVNKANSVNHQHEEDINHDET